MAQQSRVGELLAGKYRLDALLGSGGVGEVYRAQNTLFGRTVAIKLLRPEHVTDENVVARFMSEAKAATLARHPNVVDVLDVGQDEQGIPFIVQEFLEGMDLGQRLKAQARAMSPRETLDLMIPVVEAVGLAHSRGVVHRDLKPENVFLARVGSRTVPKLLDFGISYVKPKPGDIRMTKTGMTVGTPAYMSPEQLEGTEGVDARTDVWALGVILYEALAGRLPFEGESHALLFAQIAWVDPIPLREVALHVPSDLAEVVGRCLRRTVAERYPSASELARDLNHVRSGRAIEPTHKRSLPPKAPADGAARNVRMPAPGRRLDLTVSATERGADAEILPVAASIEGNSATGRSGIDLATIRPPPGNLGDEEAEAQQDGWTTASVKAAMSLGAVALVGVASWMLVLHQPGGLHAKEWLAPALDGATPHLAGLLAAACAGASLWLIVRIVRAKERLWGLLAAAAGLAVVAVPAAMMMIAPTDGAMPTAVPASVGWGLSLGVVGVAAAAAQLSWTTWKAGSTQARALSLVAAFAAATLFSAAADIARTLVDAP